jgi:hypothetical protein
MYKICENAGYESLAMVNDINVQVLITGILRTQWKADLLLVAGK